MTTRAYQWGYRAETANRKYTLVDFSVHDRTVFWGVGDSGWSGYRKFDSENKTQEYRWFLTGLFRDDLHDPEVPYECNFDRVNSGLFVIGHHGAYWKYPDEYTGVLGLQDVLGDLYG